MLAVFIFHLDRDLLPGGFVGVDVFFVISGYLITLIIYDDCIRGRFSFSRFYQRRIARIFPAFFAVALATLVGASLIYSAQDYASAGANLAAAALSVANLKYMFQGSYFEISPDAQPYLHYWSLSVEEQFYMVFPLVLYLVYRFARRHLILVLTVVGAGSLVACVMLTVTKPVWAFYLLPTRAWELVTGSLIAVVLRSGRVSSQSIPEWFPTLGMLLLGGSFVFITEGPHLPGWRAIFPVLGAAAIIASTVASYSWAQSVLASDVMAYVGKLSYSLYLWHWPVFSLTDYELYAAPVEVRLAVKVGLSVALTLLTFHLIERPARAYLNEPRRTHYAWATMAALVALCVPLGVSVRQENYVNAEYRDVAKGGLVFRGPQTCPSVVLMGDSNASMYGKLMKEICAESCRELRVISVAAGDPLPSSKGESQLWLNSLEVLRNTRPDYLVMANHWVAQLDESPARLASTLDAVKPHVGHILLLNQPPILPKGVGRSHFRHGRGLPIHEEAEVQEQRLKINNLLTTYESASVSVLDVAQYFGGKGRAINLIDDKGRFLYQDATHLSSVGTEKVRGAIEMALGCS